MNTNSIFQKLKTVRIILLVSLVLFFVIAILNYKKETKALESLSNTFVQQIEALKGQIFMFNQLVTLIMQTPAPPEVLMSSDYIYSLNNDTFLKSNGTRLANQLHQIFSKNYSWLRASDLLYFKLFDSKTVISDAPIEKFQSEESEIAKVFSTEYCSKHKVCTNFSSKENLSDGFIFSDVHTSFNSNKKTLAVITPSIINGVVIAESHIDVNLTQWESYDDKFITSERNGEYMTITVSTHPYRSKLSWVKTAKIDNYVTVMFERHYGGLIVQGIVIYVFIAAFVGVSIFYYNEKSTHSKTKLESMVDILTGCFNRRVLESPRLKKRMAEKNTNTVVAIDGNEIKLINDKYGHDIGDIAIVAIATAIRQAFRKDDVVIRSGGDEFIVIAFGLEANVAYCILDEINHQLRQTPIAGNDAVSISAGVSECKNYSDLKTAISNADIMLYKDKALRRKNTISVNVIVTH